MKGFLKSGTAVFQLSPKITTVGREKCDIVIPTPAVENQHAIIECSEPDNLFIIQDLNSAQGTYINNCRVLNAAVRLAPGDVIRFGNAGESYEFLTDNQAQLTYPAQRPVAAWSQSVTVINDQFAVSSLQTMAQNGLPQLRSSITPTQQNWPTVSRDNGQQVPVVHPPTNGVRSRPVSAGARRASLERPNVPPDSYTPRDASWSSSQGGAQYNTANQASISNSNSSALTTEFQNRLRAFGEEIKRLSAFESECSQKDSTIGQLRDEVKNLQNRLRQMELGGRDFSGDTSPGLLQLERDVSSTKRILACSLDTMSRKSQIQPPLLTTPVNNDLILELEKMKKDKNVTLGLVTQLQKDLSNKDITIGRLAKEVENMKKEVVAKDVHVSALKETVRKADQNKSVDGDVGSKDRDIALLRYKLKAAEEKSLQQNELVSTLKNEIAKLKQSSDSDQTIRKKVKTEMDAAKVKFEDIERAERMVRVDLEQVSKRLEKFRSRVIQAAYSAPGVKAPNKQINDDDLLATLKKCLDERAELVKKIQTLESSHAADKQTADNTKKLKQQLNEAVDTSTKKKKVPTATLR